VEVSSEFTNAPSNSAVFRLYVAGEAANSAIAHGNLRALCEKHYPGKFKIDVVDVLLMPEQAWQDGVVVTPMLLRLEPQPQVRLLGNLNNSARVLQELGLSTPTNG
jgi:circadian clock protein KaiB